MDSDEKLKALREAIDIGIAKLERGEGIPGPLPIEQARAEFRRTIARDHEALRQEIQKGIDDLDNGRHSPKDEVFARLRARRKR
jgi:hypothetical protein